MMSLFTVGVVVILLAIVAVVVYYAYRLARSRRGHDTTDERLRALLDARRGTAGVDVDSSGGLGGRAGAGTGPAPAPSWTRRRPGASDPDPSVVGQVRTYDGSPGLRSLSQQPVFLRKDRTGDVVFQVEDRRATPVKYVLEPQARQILTRVATQADHDFGTTWAVLASEDPEGKLVITRLV